MKVFFITIEDVIKYDISHIKHMMPKRFDRANTYKQEKDRLLCLGGAILMADIVGITNESDICFNSSGKPFANGFPEFNISHSGDVCVLAVGDGQVGIVKFFPFIVVQRVPVIRYGQKKPCRH